uniref:Uncharacterized protein n=1 Tax=Anguilla anguilla TaxID=7936 RepID=A0A0E9VRL7_ANGAN
MNNPIGNGLQKSDKDVNA